MITGMSDEVILRVSSNKEPTYVKKVAGAVGWQLREKGCCKARAVKGAVEGSVTPQCPSSILQQHAAATLFLDRASASLLDR